MVNVRVLGKETLNQLQFSLAREWASGELQTMTPEEVVRAFLDAHNKNDLDRAMACLADDFVTLGESTKWVPVSKENYRDMWARFAAAFPDFKWETIGMVVSDHTVAIEVIETGTFTEPWAWQGRTLRPTGRSYRIRRFAYFSA